MTTTKREVTWGEGLVVAAFKSSGGLNVAVRRIREIVGPTIGVRNTFGKLFHIGDPEGLDERDRFRAWLLLTTFGEDPGDWGISDDVVPAGYDIDRLREELPHLDSNQEPAGYRFAQVTRLVQAA